MFLKPRKRQTLGSAQEHLRKSEQLAKAMGKRYKTSTDLDSLILSIAIPLSGSVSPFAELIVALPIFRDNPSLLPSLIKLLFEISLGRDRKEARGKEC